MRSSIALFVLLLLVGCDGDGTERSSAEILCDLTRECNPEFSFDYAECLADPGRTLDLPAEDIDCLAECVSQYDTCQEAGAGCDNEVEGTPCYAL